MNIASLQCKTGTGMADLLDNNTKISKIEENLQKKKYSIWSV